MSSRAAARILSSSLKCPHANASQAALYRVFVQPLQARHATTRAVSLARPIHLASCDSRPSVQLRHSCQGQRRHYNARSINSQPAEKAAQAPANEAIGSLYVNFVDPEGSMHARQPLRALLPTYDRATHSLVVVQPGDPGGDEMRRWPVVKLFSHDELRQREKDKLQLQREQKRSVSSKTVELSWTVSAHDLVHRLRKAKEFLEQGRKVVVLLVRKRRAREVEAEECRDLVEKVEAELGSVPGAKQSKEPEGRIGGMLEMFWEGKREKKKKGVDAMKEDAEG